MVPSHSALDMVPLHFGGDCLSLEHERAAHAHPSALCGLADIGIQC